MIADTLQDLEREYMLQTSSRIRLSMRALAKCRFKGDEPPVYLFQRIKGIAAELQRLDAGSATKIVVHPLIDELPEDYEVLS